MTADLLVFKKRGRKTGVKVTTQIKKGYVPDSYTILVNLKDYKDIARFLHDLEDLQGAPILKAVQEYLEGTSKVWPF